MACPGAFVTIGGWRLSSRPLRALRIDLPGFGETPVAAGPDASPLGRARFVLEVLNALEVERATLVGHSMGGVVACAAASLEPERFDGLVLLASPGVRPHATLRRIPLPLIEALMAKPRIWEGHRPLTRQLFKWGGFKGYSDAALDRTLLCVAQTSIAAHAARVRALGLPTAVAWADDDPLIEAEIMSELAAVCPAGPRLRFDSGGHNIQKSQAEPIAQAIRAMQRSCVIQGS
ncbi:MAG: alpha/beta fold hydrolase [Polyangiales bacterium]